MFGQVRAYTFSTAQAFLNDFDIKSNGAILCCGFSGLLRDFSHLVSFTNRSDQPVLTNHFRGHLSLDN